jgi:hypothetical protein
MRMPRRRTLVTVAAVGVVIAAISLAPRATVAAWADREVATSSTLTAGTVSPDTTMTCTPGGLTSATRFSWTAPTGGLTRASYRWTVTGGLTGSGTLASSATFVDLPTGLLGIGSGTFSLYAVGPGGWESVAKTGTLTYVTAILASCSVP